MLYSQDKSFSGDEFNSLMYSWNYFSFLSFLFPSYGKNEESSFTSLDEALSFEVRLLISILHFQYWIYIICVKSIHVQRDDNIGEDTFSSNNFHCFPALF